MSGLVADLKFRGLVHQVTDTAVFELLEAGGLTGYIGFDPTADSLHVGNLLQLCMLRRLQEAGHRPIALAGGATGVIGDPGGKSEERSLIGDEELASNLAGIRPQLERFLDFSTSAGSRRAVLADNAAWLRPMTVIDFLRDVGKHVTVNDMVKKDSVRSRLERPDQGISFTEFSYMLLQAFDFLHLYDTYDCKLQLGGSDQWGNITTGIELVHKVRRAHVYGLTSPLVLKSDGTKFGKTESGTVWLDSRRTSSYQLYQFMLRTSDSEVGSYLRYFTFLDHDDMSDLDDKTQRTPEERRAQHALAYEVCALVHGEMEAKRAEEASRALYSEEISGLDEATLLQICADAPTSRWPKTDLDSEGLALVEALVRSELVSSKSQARTAIEQGGAYVNNRRVSDKDGHLRPLDALHGRYVVLRRGRRDYHLMRFE